MLASVDKIASFVEDLAAKRRIWYQHGEGLVGLCVAKDIGQENCLCGLHDVQQAKSKVDVCQCV